MKRRILAALAILIGEPIPHEWTQCPNAGGLAWKSWDWPAGTGSPANPPMTFTVDGPTWPVEIPHLASEIESRMRVEAAL